MVRLKHIVTTVVCLISFWGFSQSKEIDKITLHYKDTLQLDFYSSKSVSKQPGPLLVLMHGGGFASGKRDGTDESSFCMNMAEMGYAVASISYRLTRKNDPFNCDCATEKKMNSFISASEDLSEALQFMRQEKELIFDRNTIILIGSSAGAEAVLHTAFMSKDYRFSHIPETQIAGVISFSGAVSNASYITKENAVPSLFIHGKKDELVPYGTASHHYCSEDRAGYLMLDGPATLTDNLKKQGASFILAFDPEGNHDWANKAFLKTDIVNRFIQDLILDQKFVQAYIQLEANDQVIDTTTN